MSDLAKAITEHFGGRDVERRTTPSDAAVAASMAGAEDLTPEQRAGVEQALDAVKTAKDDLGFYDAYGALLGTVRPSKLHGGAVRVYLGEERGAQQVVFLSQAFAAIPGAKVAPRQASD